jgi:hypothetical protein
LKHYNHKRKFSSINFIVIFGLFLQTFTPLIAALQQIPVSHETFYVQDGAISDLSESVDLAEFNVEQLIVNVVEDAVVHDLYASLSQDLLTCYKTIIEGQTKVNADTLIKAMPELLQYAMLHENMRAPRPSTSNGNNAIASCNGGCDLTHVIQLLASIREHIGSVNDGACCNSILGILGDACNVPCIGENGSISEVLCEILDCCTQITGTINANVDLSGVYTSLADIKDTLTECCAETKADFEATWTILAGLDLNCSTTVIIDLSGVFTTLANLNVTASVEVDLSGVYTAIADVKDTLTKCCDEIKSDVFDTQTLIIDDFRQTWTILAGLDLNCSTTVIIDLSGVFTTLADLENTLTECCAEIKADIFDTQTLIISGFQGTWTILAEDFACGPIPLFQSDVDGDGEIKLTTTGLNYCLAENITGTIVITGGNVTVDGNDRVVTGRIVIDAANAIFKSAKVRPQAPVNFADAATAGIEVTANGARTQILNCLVECEDTIVDVSPAVNGRFGVHINGADEVVIDGCHVHAGKGGFNTFLGGGPTGDGGYAIKLENSMNSFIKNSFIVAGDGRISLTDGAGIGGVGVFIETCSHVIIDNITVHGGMGGETTMAASGDAGDGGHAIQIINTFHVNIENSVVTGGIGGNAGLAVVGDAGNGGDGIVNDLASDYIFVKNVRATGAIGGNSSHQKGGAGGFGMRLHGEFAAVSLSIAIGGNAGISDDPVVGATGGCGIYITKEGGNIETSQIFPGNGGDNTDGPGGNGGIGVHIDQAFDVIVKQCSILEGGAGGSPTPPNAAGLGGHGILVSGNSERIQISDCNILDIGAADDPMQVGTGILIEAGSICVQVVSNRVSCCFGPGIANEAGSGAAFYNNIVNDCNPNYINVDLVRMPGPQTGFFTNVTQGPQDCDLCDLFTVIADDFQQTWTILADIIVTITDCCAEIKSDIFDTQTLIISDFAQTWTILAALNVNVDLTGVYTSIADLKTTLTECCDEIKSDIFDTQTLIIDGFAQTWTILANLDFNISNTIFIDLNGVYTSLADIKDTLTECCDEIKSDIFDTQTLIIDGFAQTWTILANLDFNISNTIFIDLNGVYTSLADIKDTVTECCDEIKSDIFDTQTLIVDGFAQTWTILAGLDFNCSTTVIIDLNGVFTSLADVKDTLTECCDEIKDLFQQTWTILADLNGGTGCCDPILITQADIGITTFTISSPGYYVFDSNVVFSPSAANQPAIEITSNNVRLDLCGRTLSQGNATTGIDGIRVVGNTAASPRENVIIQNGSVKGFTRVGIVVGTNPVTAANTACSRITISDMDVVSCTVGGIEILGFATTEIREMILQNSRIISCGTGTGLDDRRPLSISRVIDGLFENLELNQNGASALGNLAVMHISNCQECIVNHVSIASNTAVAVGGLEFETTSSSCIYDAKIFGNSGGTFIGIRLIDGSSENIIRGCQVLDNIATSLSLRGYSFDGSVSSIRNTIVNNVASNNVASAAANAANCIGFDFDRVNLYNVTGNTASFNRAPGSGGTTNFAAGFNISTSGGAGTGVKNSTFVENFAISNDGFDGTRSYGFRAFSGAAGNTGNAYMGNNAVRNGGTAAINDYQILTDVGAAPANPGGVPFGSIRDRTITNLNASVDKFTNLRVVN